MRKFDSIMDGVPGNITWLIESLQTHGWGDFERLNDFMRAMFMFEMEKGFGTDKYKKVLV